MLVSSFEILPLLEEISDYRAAGQNGDIARRCRPPPEVLEPVEIEGGDAALFDEARLVRAATTSW